MGWVMTFNKTLPKAHRTRGLSAFLKEAAKTSHEFCGTPNCDELLPSCQLSQTSYQNFLRPKSGKKTTMSEGFVRDGSHILCPPIFAYLRRTGYLTHIRPVLEVIRQG